MGPLTVMELTVKQRQAANQFADGRNTPTKRSVNKYFLADYITQNLRLRKKADQIGASANIPIARNF